MEDKNSHSSASFKMSLWPGLPIFDHRYQMERDPEAESMKSH